MPLVTIEGRQIGDFDSFHTVFAEVFGLPVHYGRNPAAWIDCMSYLDEPNLGMTSIHGSPPDLVVLHIEYVDDIPGDVCQELTECAAFVN